MYAVQVREDDQRTLVWEETQRPSLGAGQVRVKVHATALNRADLLQRKGLYPPPPGASEIMGLEAAGELIECAPDVEGWSPGDAVCMLLEGGGYAQELVCDAGMLLPRPQGFSWEEAAALPEVFYTAYVNLVVEGGLQAGERVLLHAAASGVGTAVIQLCKAWGNPLLATASGKKLPALEALGANATFDRHDSDLFENIKAHTAQMPPSGPEGTGKGVDLIFDPVGANYLEQNIRLLRKKGRLVVIGLLGGSQAPLELGRLLRNRLRVIGSVLRTRSRAEKLVLTNKLREEVWPLFEAGSLKPIIYKSFAIEDANEAHALMASNESTGKIVMRVSH